MPKISPTDKIFNELIPDSSEYWQAIENIDFEPKTKSSFWANIKNHFFASNTKDDNAIEVNEPPFVLVPLKDLIISLSNLYPDCRFSTSWNSEQIEIRSNQGNFAARISIQYYAYWLREDYEDFLGQVRCAVSIIKDKQDKLRDDVRMRCLADDIESGRKRL